MVRILLQARTSSSRLPAKVLLPISGYPAAVLAALRAQSSETDLVVVTSTDPSDDVLVEELEKHGFSVVRGPLEDVLERFMIATADLDDRDIVVRLTADNVFPDRGFIKELVQAFIEDDAVFLSSKSPQDDLPYGLIAEAFRVSTLRKAHAIGLEEDREHVTSWMNTQARRIFRPKAAPRGLAHLRCTIDTFEDYLTVCEAFRGVADPVNESWLSLCLRLKGLPTSPTGRVPYVVRDDAIHGRLVLGSVQLGMEYGIANRTGMPSEEEAVRIIRRAIEHGVTHIDTARAYGMSEARVGKALKNGWASRAHVITKMPALKSTATSSPHTARSEVDAHVFRSCRELGTHRIDTLLLHDASDRHAARGEVWKRLMELRAEGVIGRLGISADSVEQVIEAIDDPAIQHIQLPVNLLDWRWREAKLPDRIRGRDDLTVHGRSAFLQGLLLLEDASLWPEGGPTNGPEIIQALLELVAALGRSSVADLCLAYVRAQDWIDGIVVGVETQDQLLQIIELFQTPSLTLEECRRVEARLPRVDRAALNPSSWIVSRR